MNVMDYSMLLGIHDREKANYIEDEEDEEELLIDTPNYFGLSLPYRNAYENEIKNPKLSHDPLLSTSRVPKGSIFNQDEGGCYSSKDDSEKVYFFGIIDILQKWNPRKMAEQFLKELSKPKYKVSKEWIVPILEESI